MRVLLKILLSITLALPILLAPAASRETGTSLKNSAMKKFTRKNYAGAVADFDKYLKQKPTDKDIILLRGLAKSLMKPEDVAGACADFLAVKSALKDMNVETYCANQPGW